MPPTRDYHTPPFPRFDSPVVPSESTTRRRSIVWQSKTCLAMLVPILPYDSFYNQAHAFGHNLNIRIGSQKPTTYCCASVLIRRLPASPCYCNSGAVTWVKTRYIATPSLSLEPDQRNLCAALTALGYRHHSNAYLQGSFEGMF